MQSELMDKYVQISRIVITLLIFTVLNIWMINDLQWAFEFFVLIISLVVFFVSFPSSKICKIFIKKGDKIESKLLKTLYYIFALPAIFLLLLLITIFLLTYIFKNMELSLGTGILIVFTGIGIFTCILVPYFQTLIILVLRYFM